MTRVRVVVELEIDPADYVNAGIEAEHYAADEIDPTDHEAVAFYAVGYFDAEDHMPRWARGTIRVISQTTEVIK